MDWQLARALRGISDERGSDFTREELIEIAKSWFGRSKEFLSDPDLPGAIYELRRKYKVARISNNAKLYEMAGERLRPAGHRGHRQSDSLSLLGRFTLRRSGR